MPLASSFWTSWASPGTPTVAQLVRSEESPRTRAISTRPDPGRALPCRHGSSGPLGFRLHPCRSATRRTGTSEYSVTHSPIASVSSRHVRSGGSRTARRRSPSSPAAFPGSCRSHSATPVAMAQALQP
jgi:hypothetical protein